MDREVNHGHSGVWKVVPTSLNVRISGTNLRLETLEAPKSQDLMCELGVGNLKPRRVALPQGHQPLEVPGDGKDYQLHAAVSGARTKHYCHLTLVGTPGADHLRVHVHPSCEPLLAEADGNVLYPHDGVLSLPMLAKTLQLRPAAPRSPQRIHQTLGSVPFCVVQGADNPQPVLILPNGEEIPIQTNSAHPVDIPAGSGLVQLKLPRLEPRIGPTSTCPEVDVRVTNEGDQAHILVTARGSWVELSLDGYPPQAAYHSCIAAFDPNRACAILLTVSDPTTRQVQLRQQLILPAVGGGGGKNTRDSYPPVTCRLEDGPGPNDRTLFMPHDGFVSVDGMPMVPADRGVSVDCTYPKTAYLTQRNPDGSTSTAQFSLPAKKAPDNNDGWLNDLANLLDDPYRPLDQLLNGLSQLHPPTDAGRRVLNNLGKLLGKPVPNLELRIAGGGSAPTVLSDLNCKGFNLAASHGNEAPCIIPQGGSLQMDPRIPARLIALDARGSPAATATVSLGTQGPPQGPNPDEQLVKNMLDATNASPTPFDLANRLSVIPTQSSNGQQLLPALANMLRKIPTSAPPIPGSLSHDIMVQCNVERESGIQVQMQLDGNPSQRVPPNQQVPVSSNINLLTFKLTRTSISSPYEQELIDAYKRTEPRQLSRRWAEQCHPRDEVEEELHPILVALAKELEDANQRNAANNANQNNNNSNLSGAAAIVQFVCGDGQLTNIKSEGHQVSAFVDDMPSIGVGYGGQVPPGVPFSEGTSHRVRLVARDAAGVVRGEVQTTVFGTKKSSGGSGVAYLDASIQPAEEQSLRVRLTAPPGFGINYDIDGKRGESSRGNEAVMLVDGRKPHTIGVNVVDGAGAIAFQQKLDVPVIASASWALQMQNNNISLIPTAGDRGFSTTASLDQGPERVIDGSQIRLDHDTPHQLILRKYFGDKSIPCGELLLRVAHFVDPDDTLAAARALQSIPSQAGGDPTAAFNELQKIHDRTPSGILKKLLGELLSKLGPSSGKDDYFKRTTMASGPSPAAPVVFFRLRGDEERRR
ncbi:Hypothetical protein, putative [Bodo saltans]|uniref:Uncharacterized protein n=2 Tax=Bodo saltans TaxID=75058 RepID=A0A0S4JEM1_BODSA|nr:Hypothetical protein, putative [Bodo saltans]|eukprot:CUG88741.1 Hypothetical protein, putative [Bodo saltans]